MICNVLSTLLLVSITLATKTSSAPVSQDNSKLGKLTTRVTKSLISQFTQCIGDGECNEGQYCHFRPGVPVGLCQECKDCQRYYYRNSGTRNTCAKNSNYCGECLDGYFDVLTSDGSKAERCTRHHDRIQTTPSGLSKPESGPDPSTNKLVMIIGLLSVAVAFLVAVSCIVYLLHVQNKCFWNDDDDKNDSEIEGAPDDKRSEDFEKTHTLCAAFTVVSLVILFVTEFLVMSIYLIISNGKRQISLLIVVCINCICSTRQFAN